MSEQASTAKAAFGFVFYRHNGTTFVEVQNIRMQGLPNITTDEENVTHHGSPNRKKEFKRTLGEDTPYDIEFDFDFDNAAHRGMFRDAFIVEDDTLRLYKIDFPDLEISIEGTGYVKDWKWGNMGPGDMQKATCTFRESPAWDWDVAIPA